METTMVLSNHAPKLLRNAAVTAAMILMTLHGALADAPGYLFLDLNPATSSTASAQNDGGAHPLRRENANSSRQRPVAPPPIPRDGAALATEGEVRQ
jgi:hypothetical protein